VPESHPSPQDLHLQSVYAIHFFHQNNNQQQLQLETNKENLLKMQEIANKYQSQVIDMQTDIKQYIDENEKLREKLNSTNLNFVFNLINIYKNIFIILF
jgi:hypothetical protein